MIQVGGRVPSYLSKQTLNLIDSLERGAPKGLVSKSTSKRAGFPGAFKNGFRLVLKAIPQALSPIFLRAFAAGAGGCRNLFGGPGHGGSNPPGDQVQRPGGGHGHIGSKIDDAWHGGRGVFLVLVAVASPSCSEQYPRRVDSDHSGVCACVRMQDLGSVRSASQRSLGPGHRQFPFAFTFKVGTFILTLSKFRSSTVMLPPAIRKTWRPRHPFWTNEQTRGRASLQGVQKGAENVAKIAWQQVYGLPQPLGVGTETVCRAALKRLSPRTLDSSALLWFQAVSYFIRRTKGVPILRRTCPLQEQQPRDHRELQDLPFPGPISGQPKDRTRPLSELEKFAMAMGTMMWHSMRIGLYFLVPCNHCCASLFEGERGPSLHRLPFSGWGYLVFCG